MIYPTSQPLKLYKSFTGKREDAFLLCFLLLFTVFGKGKPKVMSYTTAEQMAADCLKEKGTLAVALYGMFLKETGDYSSPLCAKTVIAFSKLKGQYNNAIALASLYDINQIVPNVIKEKDGELSAAILAAHAWQARVVSSPAHTKALQGREEEVEDGKKKKKRKKKKNKKRKNKKGAHKVYDAQIPESLFQSKNDNTVYLAILAAAYAKKAELKGLITAIKSKNPRVLAAVLLYRASIADAITAKEIKRYFPLIKKSKEKSIIAGASGFLGNVDMNVPALASFAEALGELKDVQYLKELYVLTLAKDIRVRIEAFRAIRKIASETSLPILQKSLIKAQWPELVEICLALGEMPHKSSVEPLIARFKKETGRFRLDCNYALSTIFSRRVGLEAKECEIWWKRNKKNFQLDIAKSNTYRENTRLQDVGVTRLGNFYEIGIYSDRCCFVVDSSVSMKGARIESLKEAMTTTFEGLSEIVLFNIIDFGGDLHELYSKSLTDNKKKAIQYIYDMPLTFATRSSDAIVEGMDISPVDTIYFLSDGKPSRGQIQSWEGIRRLISLKNRYRPVTFSSICFDSNQRSIHFMRTISNENYGHNEAIDIQ